MIHRAFTKVVATIGPSSETIPQLVSLLKAGVSVFRFNLKHNTPAWHSERINRVRSASKESGIPVALLLDLQGPEIRTGEAPVGGLVLEVGKTVRIVTEKREAGEMDLLLPNEMVVSRLSVGDDMIMDDGKIRLQIIKAGKYPEAHILEGGKLGSKKSVSIPTLAYDLPTLVDRDLEFISMAARGDVDFIALSFVRTAKDIEILRDELKRQKVGADIIAKIETGEAVKHITEIVEAADGLMVARGDLGVELPLEQVPYYQKQLIKACLEVGKPVITATQMLETMIENPFPTRAEVSDVANAVYDYTDAVMLSGETAIGKHPTKPVEMMQRTAKYIEHHRPLPTVSYKMQTQSDALMHAVSDFVTQRTYNNQHIKAIIVLTETGYSVRMLARNRSKVPIIALTRHAGVRDKLLLVGGVIPLHFPFEPSDREHARVTEITTMIQAVKDAKLVESGDKIIMVYGDTWGVAGNTNVMRIEDVV